jgi:hypothetical protein
MQDLPNKKIKALTDSVLSQAIFFLNEADEFYPFGSVINKDQEIKPVGIYFGDEHPDATEVLNRLEAAIKEGINKNDYLSAAIGVDVYININNGIGIEKKTALELRLYNNNSYTCSYFLYYKEEGKYILEPIEKKG